MDNLVSAIMPHHNSSRLGLARKAVNNFIRNAYHPYELVIVNTTPERVLTNDTTSPELAALGCFVTELLVPDLSTANASILRNYGIRQAKGDWILPIDSDDWSHPFRLLYQMANRDTDRVLVAGDRLLRPVLLRNQLRVDVAPVLRDNLTETDTYKPTLHLLELSRGVPSTILFHRNSCVQSAKGDNAYERFDESYTWYDEEIEVNEHAELLSRLPEPVVVDNSHNVFTSGMQWPIMSIAVYHGNNLLSRDQFFEGMPFPEDKNVVPEGLIPNDIATLKSVLQSYDFQIT